MEEVKIKSFFANMELLKNVSSVMVEAMQAKGLSEDDSIRIYAKSLIYFFGDFMQAIDEADLDEFFKSLKDIRRNTLSERSKVAH